MELDSQNSAAQQDKAKSHDANSFEEIMKARKKEIITQFKLLKANLNTDLY